MVPTYPSIRSALFPRREFQIRLASKHALNECRGFDKSACMRQARCLEHHFIHIEAFLFFGSNHVGGVNPRLFFFATRFSSPHSIGESGLDLRTGVQRSQHDDRSDSGAGKFRSDIGRDSGEAQYIDLQHLPGATRLLEILAAIIPQAEV